MEEQKFGEIFLYTTPDGSVKIEILLEGETFWLSQKKMAELFGTTRLDKVFAPIFRPLKLPDIATQGSSECIGSQNKSGIVIRKI